MANLVCGCGYLGERVARRWLATGREVWATTRSEKRAEQLRELGLRPVVVDITQPIAWPADWPEIDTVLFAVGFDRRTGQSIDEVYVAGLRNLLASLPAVPRRIVYLSSTGVYGHVTGEWVDEDSPCVPLREGGRACLAAERLLADEPAIILRLAGIYGPGRIPKLDALLRQEPLEVVERGYLNLIHVDDVVEVVLAAEARVTPPATFVISDGVPVERGEFYRELARQIGGQPPRFVEPLAESSAASRGAGDKRVRNDRMRAELGVRLRFPSYRQGLAAIAQNIQRGGS